MRILGIECTCDDTGVALVEDGVLKAEEKISSWDYHVSKPDIDKNYAARNHAIAIPKLVDQILANAHLDLFDLDAIALSTGPGLNPSLAAGLLYVQSLYHDMIKQSSIGSKQLPKFIPINHLQAHLLVPMMEFPNLHFPFTTLILSGAHTQIVVAHGYFNYHIVKSISGFGVGAMLDRLSRLWKVDSTGYGSGGAALEKLASSYYEQYVKSGNKQLSDQLTDVIDQLSLIPLGLSKDQTNQEYNWEQHWIVIEETSKNNVALIQSDLAAVCFYVQKAWVKAIIDWVTNSLGLKDKTIDQLVVAGGVASNRYLIQQLDSLNSGSIYCPTIKHCCDNGAMIAYTGYVSMKEKTNIMDYPWGFSLKHKWNLPGSSKFHNNTGCPHWNQVEPAIAVLERGQVIAFPTETVYGLGANAYDQEHVSGIYKAKGRPSDNPLIIHVANYVQLKELVPNYPHQPWLHKLLEVCWPGPLSVVLPDPNPQLAPNVHSHHLNTVAVRMPDHPMALRLIEQYNKPLAAPSANTSGKPSPTLAKHVIHDLGSRIGGVLDGGSCVKGIESTILDCTVDPPVILREGPYTLEDIQNILGNQVTLKGKEFKGTLDEGDKPKAPGMKYTHYKPDVSLVTLSGTSSQVADWLKARKQEKKRIGWIVWKSNHLDSEMIIHIRDMYICGNIFDGHNNAYLMNQLYASFWELNQVGMLDLMAIWIDGITHLGVLEKLDKAAVEKIKL